MTMRQWKSGCDYYLLSYDILSPEFVLQNSMKKCFLPQQLDCRFWPTPTVTSLKVTWNEGLDQVIQRKRLGSRNYAAYATYPPIS